jgi:hypothetical protein
MTGMTDVTGGLMEVPASTTESVLRLADLITIDLTSLLLPPITFLVWRVQVRRERRDRTLDMFRMYESEIMKQDRHDAWRYLSGETGPVVPLNELMNDPDPVRLNAYGACYGVLTFFATIHRLLRTRHLDIELVDELFESSRASWADALQTSGTCTSDDDFIRGPMSLIVQEFRATWRRSGWWARAARTDGQRGTSSGGVVAAKPPPPPSPDVQGPTE